MVLVDVGNLHRLAHFKGTLVGVFQSHDEFEEGSFSGTVRTDHADNAVRRQHEVEVVKQHLVAERLRHVLSLDNLVSEARTVGDEDFEFLLAFLLVLVEQSVVA